MSKNYAQSRCGNLTVSYRPPKWAYFFGDIMKCKFCGRSEVEKWVVPDECDGDYEVSNFGRVRSNKKKPFIMKPPKDGNGYEIITFYKGSNLNYWRGRVHFLVAKYFIKDIMMPEVNHKDGKKNHNCVNNLEWVNRSENSLHYFRTDGGKHIKSVNQFSKSGIFIRSWRSMRDAMRGTGISNAHIWRSCNKYERTVNAGGYRWEYA